MSDGSDRVVLAAQLADGFSRSEWSADALAESGAARLGYWPEWLTALVMHVMAVHRTHAPEAPLELDRLIRNYLQEHSVAARTDSDRALGRYARYGPPRFKRLAPGAAHGWVLPDIASAPELAERLELSVGQLAWLADVRGLERSVGSEQLRNYRYHAVARRGGVPRLVEAPKARLKEVQRWILREILDQIPAHEAAHGFTRGRSAVSCARVHVGQAAVLRLDLKDFFASVAAGRIYGIWRTLDYPPPVAHLLTGLTTNTVPQPVWAAVATQSDPNAIEARFQLGRQLAAPHLPQGAPTSPALANLAAFRLDLRLSGLARASGLQYSRYADDLTFSGPASLIRRRARFEAATATIAHAEGFMLNAAKSTTQSAAGRQTVCGVVVNVHTNVRRSDYDELKATLRNALVHGPSSQNRGALPEFKAHLRGRIAWVHATNPGRARKLNDLFEAIDWS